MTEKIKCPDCSASNPDDAVVCGLCGKAFIEKEHNSNSDFSYQENEPEVDYSYSPPSSQTPGVSQLIKPLLVVLIIIIIIGYCGQAIVPNKPIKHLPGIIAPKDPIQKNIPKKDQKVFNFKDFLITCAAEFDITARVLSRERYYFGQESTLSPIDLAMGWGVMSDQQILDKIEISQSGRFYYWRTEQFPIPRREIERHSANMHIIPANDSLKDTLLSIKEGHVVHIKGYLVKVLGNNWDWNSSLTRDDTGNGACEIIYAEEIQIIETP